MAYYNERKLGFINFDNVFVAPRNMSHWFVKYSGFGMNEELIYSLMEKNITRTIVMVDLKNGKKSMYLATTDTWLMKGKKYVNSQGNRDEPQLVLSKDNFDKVIEGVE